MARLGATIESEALWGYLGQVIHLLPSEKKKQTFDDLWKRNDESVPRRVLLGLIRTCWLGTGYETEIAKIHAWSCNVLANAYDETEAAQWLHACFALVPQMSTADWEQGWLSSYEAGRRCTALPPLPVNAIAADHLWLLSWRNSTVESTDPAVLCTQFLHQVDQLFPSRVPLYVWGSSDCAAQAFNDLAPHLSHQLWLLPSVSRPAVLRKIIEIARKVLRPRPGIFEGLEYLDQSDVITVFEEVTSTRVPAFNHASIRFVHLLPDETFLKVADDLVKLLVPTEHTAPQYHPPIVFKALLSRFAKIVKPVTEQAAVQALFMLALLDVWERCGGDIGKVLSPTTDRQNVEAQIDILDAACECLRHLPPNSHLSVFEKFDATLAVQMAQSLRGNGDPTPIPRMGVFKAIHTALVALMAHQSGGAAAWTLAKLHRAMLDLVGNEEERVQVCEAIVTAIDAPGMSPDAAQLLAWFLDRHLDDVSIHRAASFHWRAVSSFEKAEARLAPAAAGSRS
jgi:hypothetical protein